MSDKERMLTEAYCFESQMIEPAPIAHQHSGDHFFCTEECCLIRVVPAEKKNHYFRALPGKLHHIACPFFKEPTKGDGSGIPQPKPTPDPEPVIPTLLGAAPPSRDWDEPSREVIRQLVLEAKRRPITVPGTLADVVRAWQGMDSGERENFPLRIGGEQLNYRNAFEFLARAGDELESVSWENRIIFGKAHFTPGRKEGFLFAQSIKRFIHGETRIPLNLIIRPENYKSEPARTSVSSALTSGEGTLFWRGPRPNVSDNHGRWQLQIPDDDLYHGFILSSQIHSD